jgi:hypothetical protein
MRRLAVLLALIVGLVGGVAVPALADDVVAGTTPGGGHYRIIVPDAWNGDLVIWNHGFTLSPPGPVGAGDLGPLLDLQLAEGYAVAASSYQQNGWALFKTRNDVQNLYRAFRTSFGAPDEVILHGASLGGIVTAQAIETARVGNVVGAYPICGAVAGSRVWDGALDLRLIYDVLADGIPGAEIPGGAYGLPKDSALTETDVALAVNQATGILVPPAARTPQQQANLDTLLAVSGIPESFLLTDMGFATFGLANLTWDPGKLGGHTGIGNANVDYGDAAINAAIERTEPRKRDAARLRKNWTPKGRVGDVKIVSIHTDKDGLVIVENESEYASKVPAKNLTVGIVVEEAPSHCGFTEAEVVAGWEVLRGWIAGFPQPSAADLQATCVALDLGGLAAGPCRFDPSFVIPDMDGRVRPR